MQTQSDRASQGKPCKCHVAGLNVTYCGQRAGRPFPGWHLRSRDAGRLSRGCPAQPRRQPPRGGRRARQHALCLCSLQPQALRGALPPCCDTPRLSLACKRAIACRSVGPGHQVLLQAHCFSKWPTSGQAMHCMPGFTSITFSSPQTRQCPRRAGGGGEQASASASNVAACWQGVHLHQRHAAGIGRVCTLLTSRRGLSHSRRCADRALWLGSPGCGAAR